MAAVLKTAVGETPPGVQIPHPPPRFTGSRFTAARLTRKARLERWVSGLNHSPAKTAYSKGTESSNLSLSAKDAPVAQLDRASDYGSEGQGFESLRVHQEKPLSTRVHRSRCQRFSYSDPPVTTDAQKHCLLRKLSCYAAFLILVAAPLPLSKASGMRSDKQRVESVCTLGSTGGLGREYAQFVTEFTAEPHTHS